MASSITKKLSVLRPQAQVLFVDVLEESVVPGVAPDVDEIVDIEAVEIVETIDCETVVAVFSIVDAGESDVPPDSVTTVVETSENV